MFRSDFVCLLLKSAVVSVACVILFIVITNPTKMSAKKLLLSVEFEVHGVVQGVFFRKYTQLESKKLGIRGWCMNTEKGTVQGIMEGEATKVNEMKSWLQYTGSPSSKIEKAVFKNQIEIEKYNFSNFSIKK